MRLEINMELQVRLSSSLKEDVLCLEVLTWVTRVEGEVVTE